MFLILNFNFCFNDDRSKERSILLSLSPPSRISVLPPFSVIGIPEILYIVFVFYLSLFSENIQCIYEINTFVHQKPPKELVMSESIRPQLSPSGSSSSAPAVAASSSSVSSFTAPRAAS